MIGFIIVHHYHLTCLYLLLTIHCPEFCVVMLFLWWVFSEEKSCNFIMMNRVVQMSLQ